MIHYAAAPRLPSKQDGNQTFATGVNNLNKVTGSGFREPVSLTKAAVTKSLFF